MLSFFWSILTFAEAGVETLSIDCPAAVPQNIRSKGMNMMDLLASDGFDRSITCGAVYGFVSALLTFICCYVGEIIAGEEDDKSDADSGKSR